MKHLKLSIFAVLLNILPLYGIAQDYDLIFNPLIHRPIYEPITSPVLPASKQIFADMKSLDTGKPKEEITFENLLNKSLDERIKNTPKSNFGGYYDARLDARYDDPENRAYGVYSSPVAPTSNHGSLGIVLGSILFIGCIGAFFWFNGKTE